MEQKVGALVGIVILVVIGSVLYPLVDSEVDDLTNSSGASYVGDSAEPIVSLIPIFYWLMIGLTVIAGAIVSFRHE